MSTQLIATRSKPPEQITNIPEILLKLTKINRRYKIIKIKNIIIPIIAGCDEVVIFPLHTFSLFIPDISIKKIIAFRGWRIKIRRKGLSIEASESCGLIGRYNDAHCVSYDFHAEITEHKVFRKRK
jgi:hypothetical protein